MSSQSITWNYYLVMGPFDDDEICSIEYRLNEIMSDFGFRSFADGIWSAECIEDSRITELIAEVDDLSPSFFYSVIFQKGLGDGRFHRHPQLFHQSSKVQCLAGSHPEYQNGLPSYLPSIDQYLQGQLDFVKQLKNADVREQNLAKRRLTPPSL